MEKLDVHKIKEMYHEAPARLEKDKTGLAADKRLIRQFLEDAELEKT